MWHLTACKISVSLSFLKWNDFLSYLYVANINSEIRKQKIISFLTQIKTESLSEILQAVRCHILLSY